MISLILSIAFALILSIAIAFKQLSRNDPPNNATSSFEIQKTKMLILRKNQHFTEIQSVIHMDYPTQM